MLRCQEKNEKFFQKKSVRRDRRAAVFAADDVSMSASQKDDGTISVVVTVGPTAEGIISYGLVVEYDSSLVAVPNS